MEQEETKKVTGAGPHLSRPPQAPKVKVYLIWCSITHRHTHNVKIRKKKQVKEEKRKMTSGLFDLG